MISIIQDKNSIEETDEEFHERICDQYWFDATKIIEEVSARIDNKVKKAVTCHYNAIVSEISRLSSSESDPDRLRFLKKVKDAFSLYLSSKDNETDQIDYPAYYILLHFLEDGEKISYIGIDEKGKVTFKIDGSDLARAAVFLVDKFQPLLQMKHNRKDIEAMLGRLLA